MFLHHYILKLPPEDLKKIAADLRKEADIIEQLALQRQKQAANVKAQRRHQAKRREIVDALGSMLASGASPEAVERHALSLGFSEEQIAVLWSKISKRANKERIARRNRQIVRLAGKNLTNAEIAKRVGLEHEKSVSRILTQMRRDAPP